jgi:tRNA (cmo5U34)-methyltransferase
MARWTFDDAKLANRFEQEMTDHVPGFLAMREACTGLATQFLRDYPDARVLDLGASTGSASEPLLGCSRGHFYLIEQAPAMVRRCFKRFRKYADRVHVHEGNFAKISIPSASLALCVLSMMFVPVERRVHVLSRVRASMEACETPGMLLFVEKVLVTNPDLDDVFGLYRLSAKLKAGVGFSYAEKKALALENVLVPLSAEENERMLRRAGFAEVETFWAAPGFRGWVAVTKDRT